VIDGAILDFGKKKRGEPSIEGSYLAWALTVNNSLPAEREPMLLLPQ
jgi:hypothetical protein